MIGVQSLEYDGNGFNIYVDRYPDWCPFCHRGITPRRWGDSALLSAVKVQIQFLCPDRRCQSIFTGYYWRIPNSDNFKLENVSKGTKKLTELPKAIEEISSAFVKIYQQAGAAEQDGLLEICGVGYRKAIEFLVKDYAIKKLPGQKDEIEKKFLGKCIEDFIDDARVKSVAKRATRLGNDEAHYVRQWEGKDLEDLKALIRLTIHWLEMEAETERFERDMPDGS